MVTPAAAKPWGTPAQIAGSQLHAAILARIEPGTLDATLPQDVLAALIDEWNARSAFVDRNGCRESGKPCARSADLCRGRCWPGYWTEHAQIAAAIMKSLAGRYGQDELLYWQVGRIHDLDYLACPHDTSTGLGETHPVCLVRRLCALGFAPRGCLAVLEHAPYLGLGRHGDERAQRLSLSLSVAEDAATLFATDGYSRYRETLPESVVSILDQLPPKRRLIEVNWDRGRYSSMPRGLSVNFARLEAVEG